MSDDLTVPYGTPTPDWQYPPEKCPHCEECPTANRLDEHIRDTHASLPECTARIDSEHGLYTCAFRAGHKDGEHGDWHASIRGEPAGRTVWRDGAKGATSHKTSEGA